MSTLRLKDINKSFGSNHVLRDINLTVKDREFVVVVGPSGCGKSTMLRVIAGLELVDSGTVEIDGEVVNDTAPARRNIAMVFQTYALYPHMSVADNLSFGLKQRQIAPEEIERRINKVTQTLSLEPYLDRKPSELSGGQRQRVALGRALVRQPKLFLFDEPLSNLDAALRMNTRIEIAELHQSLGISVIYVTHDQTEAMTLADTIVVMRDGIIEQVGPPMELYNKPTNIFVAGFLGSPAMNFIYQKDVPLTDASCVGLRPEYLRLASEGRLRGNVLHFERLGSDTHLIVDLAHGQPVTARLIGQLEFERGDPVALDFDDKDMILFNDNGERIEPDMLAEQPVA